MYTIIQENNDGILIEDCIKSREEAGYCQIIYPRQRDIDDFLKRFGSIESRNNYRRIWHLDIEAAIDFKTLQEIISYPYDQPQQNRGSIKRQIRQSAEYLYCPGFHTKDDLVAIRASQNNKCYFSGEELSDNPKNHEIDHLTPVADCGSFWPRNLVFTTKSINQDKGNNNYKSYMKRLKSKHGVDWHAEQLKFQKNADILRNEISSKRERQLDIELRKIQYSAIRSGLFDFSITLDEGNEIILEIDNIHVSFPSGFVRKRALFKDGEYFHSIAREVLKNKSRT